AASGQRGGVAHARRRPGPSIRRGRQAARSQLGRGGRAGAAVRPRQTRRREGRAALARVRPPVQRPDADRAARGRHRQPLPAQQLGTGVLLILLTLFNAVMGLRQEGKAAAAVAALQKMTVIKARVRRDGQLAEIPAGQLVPGDIVSIEAGDVVPADGRLLKAATLEADESALTGEGLPVSKGTEPVQGAGTPLGDRADMVYMNT